jgi:hypothetical protein
MRSWRCGTLDLWGFVRRACWLGMGRRWSAETVDKAETRDRSISAWVGSTAGRRWGVPLIAKVAVGRSAGLAGRGPAIGVTGLGVCGLRERPHEVSILIATIGSVGRWRGEPPCAKVSMMIMRLPQRGQGCTGVCGALASVRPGSAALVRRVAAASSSRARASDLARELLANRP